MKLKIILGIGIPALLILILVVLHASNIGFSVEKSRVVSIDRDEFMNNETYNGNAIVLETITIKNDFFMPKRYALPDYLVCLDGGNTKKANVYVRYSESDRKYNTFDEIFFEFLAFPGSTEPTIEVPAYGEKVVRISVDQIRVNEYNKAQYESYTQLVVIPKDDFSDRYPSCYKADAAWDHANTIALV